MQLTQDLRAYPKPFGSVIILLVAFVKLFLLSQKPHPADEFNVCLKIYHLWYSVQSRLLTMNMRSNLLQQDNSFASNLSDVSNRRLPLDVSGLVDVSTIGNYVSIPDELYTTVYSNLSTNYVSHKLMCERTILALTNTTVYALNISASSITYSRVVLCFG